MAAQEASPGARSPYEVALGDRFAELQPSLARYFGAIPVGSEGVGRGVFETVGTPRRWLRPLLALFAGQGIVFPVWERDVPFEIINRPFHGRARLVGVTAERRFAFPGGARTMTDRVTADDDGLVDTLGTRGAVRAVLDARVVDGGLVLSSTRVELRLGRLRWRMPRAIAPVVTVTERADGAAQRVAVTLDAPVLGRLYEYTGRFEYRIREEGAP